MKKLLFTLAALITAMTMSAQLSFVKSPVSLPSNTQDFTLRSSQNLLGLYSHDFINPEIEFGFGSVAEGTQCAVAVALWPEKLADFQGGNITAFKLGFTKPVNVNGVFVATCKVDSWGEIIDIDNWTEWECDVMADLGWNIIDVPTPFTINTDEDTHLLIGFYMIQPSLENEGNYLMGVSDMISEEEMHDYSLWLYTGESWMQQYFSEEYNYYLSVQCIVEMDDDIDPTQQCQAPNGYYNITGLEQATITLNNNEPDATVFYQVYCDGVFISEGEFTGDSYSFTVEGVGTYQVTATAKKDGYKDSTPGGFFFTIHEGEAPEPEPTATPTIKVDVYDTEVVISAEGEGEVILMIDGEVVDNPTTIARGEVDVVVTVTATAQAEGQLISEVATMEVTIPALEGEQPEDPHDAGVWVVFFDKDENEVWYEMTPGADIPTPYTITLPLNKKVYGYPTATEWPNADFYIVIEGEQYGPEAYEELTEDNQFGDANKHELFQGTEHFAVPTGYWYTIGVITDRETGEYYMQISRGIFTGVEELNADKTVAGVRYFNMAGQEMQQADGLTIMITTYTDGTTVATKVIK